MIDQVIYFLRTQQLSEKFVFHSGITSIKWIKNTLPVKLKKPSLHYLQQHRIKKYFLLLLNKADE